MNFNELDVYTQKTLVDFSRGITDPSSVTYRWYLGIPEPLQDVLRGMVGPFSAGMSVSEAAQNFADVATSNCISTTGVEEMFSMLVSGFADDSRRKK